MQGAPVAAYRQGVAELVVAPLGEQAAAARRDVTVDAAIGAAGELEVRVGGRGAGGQAQRQEHQGGADHCGAPATIHPLR